MNPMYNYPHEEDYETEEEYLAAVNKYEIEEAYYFENKREDRQLRDM